MRRRERKRRKSTRELVGSVRRLIRALALRIGSGESDDWDDGLYAFVILQEELKEAMAGAVERLRESGVSDGQIAEELGVSRQAVSQRWPAYGKYQGAAGRFRKPRPSEKGEA